MNKTCLNIFLAFVFQETIIETVYYFNSSPVIKLDQASFQPNELMTFSYFNTILMSTYLLIVPNIDSIDTHKCFFMMNYMISFFGILTTIPLIYIMLFVKLDLHLNFDQQIFFLCFFFKSNILNLIFSLGLLFQNSRAYNVFVKE